MNLKSNSLVTKFLGLLLTTKGFPSMHSNESYSSIGLVPFLVCVVSNCNGFSLLTVVTLED